MQLDKSMVKLRWLALGSILVFLSVMKVDYLRGWLFIISIGLLYNLFLSVNPDEADHFHDLSTALDLAGIGLAIVFSGGAQSVFFMFLAFYIFSISLRFGLGKGLLAALIAGAAFSYFYFINPTNATVTLVLTRVAMFMMAPFAAALLAEREKPQEKAVEMPAPREEQVVTQVMMLEPEADGGAVQTPVKPKKQVKMAKALKKPVQEAPAEPPVAEEPVKEEPVKEEPFRDEPVTEEPVIEAKKPTIEQIEESMQAQVMRELTENGPEQQPKPLSDTSILKEKITELSILHEASKALGASLILDEVLDTAVDIALKGLMADVAGTLIYDEKNRVLNVHALRGFSGDEREKFQAISVAPGDGLFGEVFSKKQTINVHDINTDEYYRFPANGRIKSIVVTPLATDGYEIGVLFLGKFLKEPFTHDAEEFLETIAGQAAIAIENARLYAQAQELAIHNGLTGIFNYRYFMKQLEEEIKRAERYDRSVSLVMMDIDLFKHVNDTYGHRRGDDVLKGMAQTLISNTRETDIVSRYGGEEFAIILPETDLENAMEVATKLRTAVAKSHYARRKGESITLTVSLGVATFPETASNQEELLRQADDALYSAKETRNTVCNPTNNRSTLS